MAHQFTDTFCTVNSTAQAAYEAIGGGTYTYSSSYARFAPPPGCQSGGVLIPVNGYLRKNLSSNQQILTAFVSFGALGMPTAGQQSAVVVFLDNGTFQTGLQWTPSGALQFVQNITNIGPASNPGLIQTATKPINGIEVQVKIASSGGGFVNCWLNGALVISATGLTTQTSANAYANQVQIGGQSGQFGGSDQGFYTDYLRVWDSTGTTQNAPVGFDVQPVTKLASKVGLTTQFTPNGLPANYQCVSVVPPNGGDFVAASIAGIHDDYGVPVAGFTTAPNQVVVSSYYQKTDSNTRTYTNGVLSGTAVGTGATFTANSGLTWVQSCIANDPATNQPWTAAGADAAHIYHTEVS